MCGWEGGPASLHFVGGCAAEFGTRVAGGMRSGGRVERGGMRGGCRGRWCGLDLFGGGWFLRGRGCCVVCVRVRICLGLCWVRFLLRVSGVSLGVVSAVYFGWELIVPCSEAMFCPTVGATRNQEASPGDRYAQFLHGVVCLSTTLCVCRYTTSTLVYEVVVGVVIRTV